MTIKEKVAVLTEKIGNLDKKMDEWKLHFTNHVSDHKWDKILRGIYFLAVIVMFCYLKWGA